MKKIFAALLLFLTMAGAARSQSIYQQYSYQVYQKLNADVYSAKSRQHSSLRPFFADDSLIKRRCDSLMNYGSDGKSHGGVYAKLFTGI